MPPTDAQAGRIRRWWAAQFSDGVIARRLGVRAYLVSRWRRRLGLPPWYGPRLGLPHPPEARRAIRDNVRRQLAAAGVRSIVQLGAEPRWARGNRDLAARYGLPPDLYPTQVRILLALAGEPKTVPELLAATGRAARRDRVAIHAFNYARVAGSNYLTALRRRGLVARVPTNRGAANGSGAGPGLYLLTALAMSLLTAPKEADPCRP